MPSTKRPSPRPTMARKSAPSAPARGSSRTAREGAQRSTGRPTRTRRKTPTGGVLAKAPTRHWSWNRLSPERKLDILGVVLALIGLLALLSLLSSQNGLVTGWLVTAIKRTGGYGSFILPVVFILVGVWLVLRNVERLPMLSAERITGLFLLYFNILTWLHLGFGGGWELAEAGLGGGYLGAAGERLLVGALGTAGAVVALAAWSLIAIALTLDISVSEIFHFVQNLLASLARRINQRIAAGRKLQETSQQAQHSLATPVQPGQPEPGIADLAAAELPAGFTPLGSAAAQAQSSTAGSTATSKIAAGSGPAGGSSVSRPRTQRGIAAMQAREGGAPNPPGAQAQPAGGPQVTHRSTPLPPWKKPAIEDILDPAIEEATKSNQDADRGKLIEETLASFGVPVKVVAINHGPTVTQFGVEPLYVETRSGQTRVRVSKIVSLADDLALALAAPRIRIQAPVPGRNYVGIEVPNLEVSRVVLRDVMESDAFRKLKSPLRFALGKDVAGHPKAYDLTAMPHLLIAGTTGSGKSVCVNSILTCLLLNNTPTELRMILVDPKRVELTGYNGIPHLLSPVVVEAEQVIGALQWVQREMDARYHRFSQVGARNIAEYNARFSPPYPYLLVLIDELADLMMLAPDETERSLTRLAQLARATGIHLVLATQRPSVDVVTGLIKANFPARVAFAVASGTDSRVILDQPGAERLLGRGDMLFQAPDAAAPVRLQGVWISDPEIQRLVEYWRQQAYELRDMNLHVPTATPVNMDLPLNTPLKQTPLWEDENGKPADPLLPEATRIVREEGKASISMLQRKLRIGYTRSARLIEQLEEKGIIGPQQPTSQVREVLDYGEENRAEAESPLE